MSHSSQKLTSHWNGRVSITLALVLVIGLLTLVSVGSVLGIGIWVAQKNTFSLLSENAHQGVSAAVSRIRQYLDPVERAAMFLADRISSGEVSPDNSAALENLFRGALAGMEQADPVIYIDDQQQALISYFDSEQNQVIAYKEDFAADKYLSERGRTLGSTPRWGAPIWREPTQKTYLNMAAPVIVQGEYKGAISLAIPIENLSGFLAEIRMHESGVLFILYGKDQVLAHPLMVRGNVDLNEQNPLPLLEGFKDPVLASFWQEQEGLRQFRLDLPEGTQGKALTVSNKKYVTIYQTIPGMGGESLLVGVYFEKSVFGAEVELLAISIGAGLFMLLLSLLTTVLIGRKIARPIVRFSNAASGIQNLDLSQVRSLPGSRLRELNDQSVSFNAMLRALHWFELYVPNRVVEHLIKRGDTRKMISDSRNVTVMFTDMVGFSSLSEGMSAREVAALVNAHFTLIGACIDAEQGTVDKYMGDSVMAFWGAPEKQKHRADRACRAALAIAVAIREDNRKRLASGQLPIGIRIGIHTGDVTVGNIGAPGRINYTIIGDAVNIGARLEQLAKEVYPADTEVSILISGDTARDLGDEFNPVSIGQFKLKGRDSQVEVFSLG